MVKSSPVNDNGPFIRLISTMAADALAIIGKDKNLVQ